MRSHLDALLAALIALGAFLLDLRTLAPSILPGDPGEFQFAAPLLGVAHPTGYPLYLLLGKLFTILCPAGDLAFRMNALSAVLSAAALAAVYLLARQLDLHPLPSAVAALSLAFSRTFWSQALEAEVYALNSLLVATMLLCLVRAAGRDLPDASRRAWLVGSALLAGLASAHHRTIILLAPAAIVFVWLHRDRLAGIAARRWWPLVAALVAPLVLYLYVPLRAPTTPYFHLMLTPQQEITVYDGSLGAFLQLVSGQGFQSELSLAAMDARLSLAVHLLLQQYGPVGLALGLLGALALLLRDWRAFMLLAMSYLAVVAFCLAYRIGDIADLFTPSYLLFALFMGFGLEAISFILSSPLRDRHRRLATSAATVVALAGFLLPLNLAVSNLPAVDRSADGTRARWAQLLEEPVPGASILVTNDRDEMMPFWYLQFVEGYRPDMLGLFPRILPSAGYANVVRLLDTVQATGRPIYLIKDMPGLDVRYSYHPSGPLFRVDGPVSLGVPQRQIVADLADQVRLLGADLTEPAASPCGPIAGVPAAGTTFSVTLHWQGTGQATADYQSFVHILDKVGRTVAQSDHRPGGVFYPSSLWQSGEAIRDVHQLSTPPPGTYRLVCGMYLLGAPTRLGETVDLGEVHF